jgi:PAS domain S-box-containing protein
MKENIEKRVVGLFFLMVAILIGIAWLAVKTINQSQDTSDWVRHTYDVIGQAKSVSISLGAGDSAMRAYLLTGDARDQLGYRTNYAAMVSALDVGARETRRDISEQAQYEKFLTLTNLIGKHIAFTRTLVQARQQGGIDAARQLELANPEAESTADINAVINQLQELEDTLLQEKDRDAKNDAVLTNHIVYSGVIANFVLLLFAAYLIRDDLKARRIAATALEEANAQLEAKVQERTAELVKSNQALKKENLERRWSYQALDHQFRYNQLIVNAVTEMVFVISKALNISRTNPSVTHLSKWEPQELISQSIERVLQLPTEGPTHPLLAALNEGRELQDRPGTMITKTGARVPVHFNLVPLRDDDKVVGGVVTVRIAPGAPAAIS